MIIARALAAARIPTSVLARLGGDLGTQAVQAARELATLGPDDARTRRATWAASAIAPVPMGLRGAHASWIDAGLADLPPRARAELAGGAPREPVGVWLVRRACAELPPLLPADRSAPPTSLSEATRMPGEALARWLAHVGADQLALAVGMAGPEALAGAVRAAGERVLVAWRRIVLAPRHGHLGSTRAAITRCKLTLDGRALVLIGARALAPHTQSDPTARQRLAVRLARDLGLAVRSELHAFANTPLAQAPTWTALGAPI